MRDRHTAHPVAAQFRQPSAVGHLSVLALGGTTKNRHPMARWHSRPYRRPARSEGCTGDLTGADNFIGSRRLPWDDRSETACVEAVNPVLMGRRGVSCSDGIDLHGVAGLGRQRDVNPVTHESSGPYEVWQVMGVASVLALLAGTAAWLRHSMAAIVVISVTSTVCWSVGAATDPHVVGANLWPIGAVGVAVGCLGGTAVALAWYTQCA